MAEDQGIIGAMEKHKLDAMVMPTFTSFYLPAIAGLPIVTVPMGFLPANTPVSMNSKGTLINCAPGIPFGLAFVGRRWSEETLISFAYAFEQRTMVRSSRKPYIRPTFELGDQILGRGDADSASNSAERMKPREVWESSEPSYMAYPPIGLIPDVTVVPPD
ncbi:MAG: hypothetical protein Q9163_001838 [Psora crenata]